MIAAFQYFGNYYTFHNCQTKTSYLEILGFLKNKLLLLVTVCVCMLCKYLTKKILIRACQAFFFS